ncbi:actin maturation protease-like [Artemia franciscana]|uniref:Actin maturation protease n=1 Tax=Artemia franciscana TaxID=6661 RepID=A0AA88I1W0_ARTSF|nr:hypothetical protein QYM36_003626 [Artemia franciscana]KAK2721404.1 hypothetical protein QYM36_003626 [Artemia franciscana]
MSPEFEKEISIVTEKAYYYYSKTCSDSCVNPVICIHESMPLLQNGPQCGLVALSTAVAILDLKQKVRVQEWFDEAKAKGYTKQGELFSSQYIVDLVNHKIGKHAKLFKIQNLLEKTDCWKNSLNLTEKVDTILSSLLKKEIVLMPYDCDYNHEPALKKGHKSHWAVIIGFVIFSDHLSPLPLKEKTKITHPSGIVITVVDSIDDLSSISKEHIYVVCRQGKSKHLGVWPLLSLLASNSNLVEYPPSLLEDGNYILPTEGIDIALKDTFVVISKEIVG